MLQEGDGFLQLNDFTHSFLKQCTCRFFPCIFLLACFFLMPSTYAIDSQTAFLSGDTPITLTRELRQIPPPDIIFNQSTEFEINSDDSWYQLDMERSAYSITEWRLIFRQVPHQHLDIFIPNNNGYQLEKLGVDSNSQREDFSSLLLTINPGETQTWYIRHQSIEPNRLAPQIWPEDLYIEQDNNQEAVIFSVQALLLASLLFISLLTGEQRNRLVYLLIGHVLLANILLIMWQGNLFRIIPWPGDPGHSIIVLTTLLLISGIFCYRHLTSMPTHAPLVDKVIQGCCALVVALEVYFLSSPVKLPAVILETAAQTLYAAYMLVVFGAMHCWYQGIRPARMAMSCLFVLTACLTISWQIEPWPRSLPSYPEIILFSLHSALLPIIYWMSHQLKQNRNIAINVVNPVNQKRRVYESALRQYLHNPDIPASEADIPVRILNTVEQVLPDIPAVIAVYEQQEWQTIGEYSRAAENLKEQLPSIEHELLQAIGNDLRNQINFKDKLGRHYWIFPLSIEKNKTRLLILAPPKGSQNGTDWQTAGDISSHARTLYHANRQSRFWQQQASLDDLTGLLNRRAFSLEAKPLIHKAMSSDEIQPCSLLFMDIDYFKAVNDQFGHSYGDQVLKDIASVCRNALRHGDILCRYGGEEFVVLLPDTEPWQALHVAERIRHRVENTISLPDCAPVTISIGLSALSSQTGNLELLIRDADKSMYEAKQSGRNQTCLSNLLQDSRLPV